MKLHIVLYVLGSLILIAAWLAQQRYNDQQTQQRNREAVQLEDRVAARVSEGTAPIGQLDEIRRELARRGADPTPTAGGPRDTQSRTVEERVRAAIQGIPAEIRAGQQQALAALMRNRVLRCSHKASIRSFDRASRR